MYKYLIIILLFPFAINANAKPSLASCITAPDTEASPYLLTLRATSSLPKLAISWITRYSKPEIVRLNKGQAPKQVIVHRCGHFSETYWDGLTKLQKNQKLKLTPVLADTEVAFPACLYWAKNVEVPVIKGDTLDTVLNREIGLRSSTIRKQVNKLNPDLSLDKLDPSQSIKLPLVTRPTTIALKRGCFNDKHEAKIILDYILWVYGRTHKLDKKYSQLLENFALENFNSYSITGKLIVFTDRRVGGYEGYEGDDYIYEMLQQEFELPNRTFSYDLDDFKKLQQGLENKIYDFKNQDKDEGVDLSNLSEKKMKVYEYNNKREPKKSGNEKSGTNSEPITDVTKQKTREEDIVTNKRRSEPAQYVASNTEYGTIINIVEPLLATNVDINKECLNAKTSTSKEWPFDRKQVSARIKKSTKQARQRYGYDEIPKKTIVGIFDTGVDERKISLKEYGKWRGNKECTKEQSIYCYGIFERDDDNDQIIDEIYGINIDRRGDTEPFASYDHRYHGTQVADLVLGGEVFRDTYSKLSSHIKIRVNRIIKYANGKVQGSTDGDLDTLLLNTIHEASVFNFSLGTNHILPGFKGHTKFSKEKLFVVAAGNEKKLLSPNKVDNLYPAAYGGVGANKNNIITVGAHGGDGKRAKFSNWGPEIVDLVAPGCQLDFVMPPEPPQEQEQEQELYGTSFAAPIVTFTAAIIRSLGIEKAADIKTRILVSADYEPALKEEVFAGSRLNVVKAITLFDDVLTLRKDKNGNIVDILGKLTDIESGEDFCKTPTMYFPSLNNLKIRPEGNTTESVKLHFVWKDNDGLIKTENTPCTPRRQGVKFKSNCPPSKGICEQDPKFYPWTEISDIVTRHW